MATINGGPLADTLFGDTNPAQTNDVINGYGGNDVLVGGYGSDALNGGVGTDTADYSQGTDFTGPPTAGVFVHLGVGQALDSWGFIDTLTSIENIKGTNFADTLTGDGNVNRIDGLGGDDIIYGGGGNDVLNGGAGDDLFNWVVGDGVDNFNGGAGTDTINFYSGNFTGLQDTFVAADKGIEVIEDSDGGGNDIVGSSAAQTWDFDDATFVGVGAVRMGGGDDTVTGTDDADNIYGDAGKDTLNGDDGDDNLFGGDGADKLNGNEGDDNLYGGLGNDKLNGNAGNDELYGEDGKDVLNGGAGDDILSGGPGVDEYTGGNGNDQFYLREGEIGNNPLAAEVITDFQGANQVLGPNQDFINFDVDHPGQGALTLLAQVDANTGLYQVSDGDATPEFVIINTGGQPLLAGVDFAFI